MIKRIFISLLSLILVFGGHALYTIFKAMNTANKWVDTGGQNYFLSYFFNQDYITGLSLALAISFTVFAVMKYTESRRKAAGGILGGLTLTGFLSFGLCFMLGCCGSPMLIVYLSLFGSAFIGFLKPLFLVLTVASVTVGIVFLEKKNIKKCDADCSCTEEHISNEALNEK